ncbi:MAG: hypothetical protein NTU63_01430 [Candidatus Pacearchaeota archaeon]|nr:hypothetical protein [Candidatus Pacearchaeota archaeon]
MERTLAETIKEITKKHLEENNGLIMGQCLTAVGWVNHTVPDCENIIELPMIDVAGSGIVAGAALVGRRPIFVIRFQDFINLNSSFIVDYAAKTKYLFGYGTPIFIRALSTEGKGAGPTHSAISHSYFMHVPGIKVCSPMTPGEYQEIWDEFMKDDCPMYVSEHRHSFNQTKELEDIILPNADITLYGISASRFNMIEAAKELEKKNIKCNLSHILWLKPLSLDRMIKPLKESKLGLVIDSDFEIAGASQSIAYELMKQTGYRVEALGAEDRPTGTYERYENGTPKVEKIVEKTKNLLKKK